MRPDPKIRKDGTCYVCRKPIEISARRGVDPALYVDPFCSTACSRAYFEIDEPRSRHQGTVKSY